MNFNEIFRKNVTCDNIVSHKKSELYPLSRKHNFGKNTGWSNWQPSLFRAKRTPRMTMTQSVEPVDLTVLSK